MTKIERLKTLISELKPEERAQLDQHLVGMVSADAEVNRKQYDFVLASDYVAEARELAANWGKLQGLSTGYHKLDELTRGLVAGELIVVAGATSHGKTALAVNICTKLLAQGQTALFVTLEMTKAQLTSRMLFVDDNFEQYAANLAYQIEDELNWQSIDGLIARAVKDLHVQVVIIDHLHYFSREVDSRLAEDIGRITKELKKNAMRYKVPMLLISHVRKTGKGEKTTMEDLRGSSYIAQDADIVIMVNKDLEFPKQITVSCEKNRNRGIPDTNMCILDFDRTRITERW